MNWKLVSYLVTIVFMKLTGTSLLLYYFSFLINDADDDKIVGGHIDQKSSVSYLVSLNVNRHICGGSLINNQWVVSAATCYRSQIQVRLGKHHLSLNDGSEQYINSAKIIRHPSYNSRTFDNDIMLIKLSTPVTLNSQDTAVSLPTSCVTAETECLIFGQSETFGNDTNYHDTLQRLKAPVLSSTQCENAYPGQITNNMICLGFVEGRSRQGDGGYPVICNGQLQGLVSWGTVNAYPGVYTKVCNYVSWIERTIQFN